MHQQLISLLALLPLVTPAYINCQAACQNCQLNLERSNIVEVYCAMCRECRARQRQRLSRSNVALVEDGVINIDDIVKDDPDRSGINQDPADDTNEPVDVDELTQLLRKVNEQSPKLRENNYPIEIPDGCPTPPICDSDDDVPITLRSTMTTTKTTTTTTTTTPRPTCPPVRPCRKRRRSTAAYYMPCVVQPCMMPCPGPCPWPYPQGAMPLPQLPSPPGPSDGPKTTTGDSYVYIGVTKESGEKKP